MPVGEHRTMMPPTIAPTPWAEATVPAMPVPPPYRRAGRSDQTDERDDRQVVENQERDAVEAARRRSQGAPSSDQSIEDRAVAAGRPNLRRTSVTATARTTNEAALKPIVQAGPTSSTSAVPSKGPMMRPLFQE